MPLPLSTADPDRRRFYTALREDPCDALLPVALADWEEEHGLPSAEIHRGIDLLRKRLKAGLHLGRPDQFFQLRSAEFTATECNQVLARLQRLLATPADQLTAESVGALEAQVSGLLGMPAQSETLPDPRQPEQLKEQYELQCMLLASLDLLESRTQEGVGITGIDGRFHCLPSLQEIQTRLQSPELAAKVEQGFNQLLLVPFALSLNRLLDAWRQGLRRNEHILNQVGGLDRDNPLWVWSQYQAEELVYHPHRFTDDHGGQTKQELLAAGHPGFDVLLVEGAMTDMPRQGQGETLAGRRQIGTGRTPEEYLASLADREIGWTPDTYLIRFLQALECQGQVLDRQTYSFLIGAYFPSSRCVPGGDWSASRRQADLSGGVPVRRDSGCGARVAVRVC